MNLLCTSSHLFKKKALTTASIVYHISQKKNIELADRKNSKLKVQQINQDRPPLFTMKSFHKFSLAINHKIALKLKAYFSSSKPIKRITWQFKEFGALLKYPKANQTQTFNSQKFLIFVHQEFKFGDLFTTMGLPLQLQQNELSLQEFAKLPKGLTKESLVFKFLADYQNAQRVQFFTPFQTLILQNKAMQSDSMQILRVVSDKNSIFGVLRDYRESIKPNTMADMNKFIVQYYLKMHALHYLRVNKVPLSSRMDQSLKSKIFNHVQTFFEQNIMKQLRVLMNQEIRVQSEIQTESAVKQQLQNKINSKVIWYKVGAIVITATHVASFTYMIFFVDWLGWDIIQPITYSVAILYTFLGIRFYRKYHLDRSDETVKLKLSNIFSSSEQKIRIQQHQAKILKLRAEKKTYSQKILLLKNRLRFQSSLGQNLSKIYDT